MSQIEGEEFIDQDRLNVFYNACTNKSRIYQEATKQEVRKQEAIRQQFKQGEFSQYLKEHNDETFQIFPRTPSTTVNNENNST